jgi:hypothetical protein
MTRSAAFLLCVIAAVGCQDESRRAPEAGAPANPTTTSQTPPAKSSSEENVRALVREFGGKLQLVSVLAPPEVVEKSMREHYAPFVASELLQRWIDNPATAPGRQVSSPWPDRIEIIAIKTDGADRYSVEGEVVEITSNRSVAHKKPVRLVVEEAGGKWCITNYSTPAEDEPGADAAVAILNDYYAAINRRDYERAYRYWSGEGSASGQSLEQFRNGFADTAAVEIRIGTPGRIDPATGSRHIELPIEITATTTSGTTQRFRGNYVLRRSVVDGATAEQRQWRIDRQRSMPLEVLHRPLVLFCGVASLERPEIATFSGTGILLSRVEPIFA